MSKSKYRDAIPLNDYWAKMPIELYGGLSSRFENMIQKPPKYAFNVLWLVLMIYQRENRCTAENRGVELSEIDLCELLNGASKPTIHKAIQWLIAENWVYREKGNSTVEKSVFWPNIDKVLESVDYRCITKAYQKKMYELQAAEMIERIRKK